MQHAASVGFTWPTRSTSAFAGALRPHPTLIVSDQERADHAYDLGMSIIAGQIGHDQQSIIASLDEPPGCEVFLKLLDEQMRQHPDLAPGQAQTDRVATSEADEHACGSRAATI